MPFHNVGSGFLYFVGNVHRLGITYSGIICGGIQLIAAKVGEYFHGYIRVIRFDGSIGQAFRKRHIATAVIEIQIQTFGNFAHGYRIVLPADVDSSGIGGRKFAVHPRCLEAFDGAQSVVVVLGGGGQRIELGCI